MQARVLSLLQKGTTSIIKKEEEDEETFEEKKPNTVVVKLSTGSGPPQIVDKKVIFIHFLFSPVANKIHRILSSQGTRYVEEAK